MQKSHSRNNSGFTIVELLVVIVVIGILAAITIVSYAGISQRAIAASLQSDISNASQQLKVFQAQDDSNDYPTANNCPTPGSTEICLKASGSNSFTYVPNNTTNPSTFTLTVTNDDTNTSYYATNETAPIAGLPPITCPTGFIVVPGSSTYGTSDFCVMKYEAKNVGGVATSQAADLPWVSNGQTNSSGYAVAACTGCHLISEAEWLTIAQNVLGVASNWSGGAVGTGYIYSGHNDSNPGNALEADSNDSNGYYGTGNTTPSSQRRTLTLSNGAVIWDLAGNVMEWTSGTVQSPTVQPGITGEGLAFREWTAITNPGTLPINPSPSATGISGASGWNTTNGVGNIYSSSDDTLARAFVRGGYFFDGSNSGVLSIWLNYAVGSIGSGIGFRVAK